MVVTLTMRKSCLEISISFIIFTLSALATYWLTSSLNLWGDLVLMTFVISLFYMTHALTWGGRERYDLVTQNKEIWYDLGKYLTKYFPLLHINFVPYYFIYSLLCIRIIMCMPRMKFIIFILSFSHLNMVPKILCYLFSHQSFQQERKALGKIRNDFFSPSDLFDMLTKSFRLSCWLHL